MTDFTLKSTTRKPKKDDVTRDYVTFNFQTHEQCMAFRELRKKLTAEQMLAAILEKAEAEGLL